MLKFKGDKIRFIHKTVEILTCKRFGCNGIGRIIPVFQFNNDDTVLVVGEMDGKGIFPCFVCEKSLWLFNGSFANYTVVDNGISTYLKYSISSVSFISGTYTVTLNSSYLRKIPE